MIPLGSLTVGAAAEVVGAPLATGVCGLLLTAAAVQLGRPLRAARG
jgi:hypothetical protein